MSEASISRDGEIVIKSRDKTKIKVTPELVGVGFLPDVLEQRLPRRVLLDLRDDLQAYRRFVGA